MKMKKTLYYMIITYKELFVLDKVFHLLTEEYRLILATTQEDFQAVEDIRNDVIVNH